MYEKKIISIRHFTLIMLRFSNALLVLCSFKKKILHQISVYSYVMFDYDITWRKNTHSISDFFNNDINLHLVEHVKNNSYISRSSFMY